MKKTASFILLFFCAVQINAQVLFIYGKKVVTKQEFLTAFNKNPNPEIKRSIALEEYKNLFINFKLKVQSALDDKLDEKSLFKSESETFKKQIAESFINEEANIKLLLNEAFERSQKDIQISQIFIANTQDSVSDRMNIHKAYGELKTGKDFNEVLQKFCTDKGILSSNGNIGYITVFSLPYEIENIVYTTKKGDFALPYKSAYGWHIFKINNERPASGKRKIAQILLSYPPNYTQAEKESANASAEMLYARVKKGEDFTKLANEYSNDFSTASNGGNMGEVGLGKFNSNFEEQIFKLKNKDEISPLVYTNYGVHILKLLENIPVAKSMNDDKFIEALKVKLDQSERLSLAKKNLIKKWTSLIGFRKAFYNEKEAWRFIDSSLRGNKDNSLLASVNDSTLLFSVAKQNFKLSNFIDYIKNVRYSNTDNGNRDYSILIKMFEESSCAEYYKNNLDLYNAQFKSQLNEFNDANLLFAAMDKHVWNKVAEDTLGLQNHFKVNQNKYQWLPGISAITVTANSLELANTIANKISLQPSSWREIVYQDAANVVADSSRYEYEQLPHFTKKEDYKLNSATTPNKNLNEDTYTFVYVLSKFNEAEPRAFKDARGLVMNDYQQVIEKKWLESLKKKYPVKFNEPVWKTIK